MYVRKWMKGILYTYQVLGSPYNVRGDTAGCDLIKGDDGVPSPQLSLLDQFLPCHLCVHNHVVQLSNTKQINNSVQTQTHREGERMNISVTILNSLTFPPAETSKAVAILTSLIFMSLHTRPWTLLLSKFFSGSL